MMGYYSSGTACGLLEARRTAMGIMSRLFRGGVSRGQSEPDNAEAGQTATGGQPRESVRMGPTETTNGESPVLTVSALAQEKIRAVLDAQPEKADTIRVSSPYR